MKYIISLVAFFRRILKDLLIFIKIKGTNVNIGRNLNFKTNSRVKSWLGNGHIQISDQVSIGYNSELYVWNGEIKIGSNTSLNDNCKLYENVRIGANCLLASNIFISSGSHSIRNSQTLPIKSQDKLFPMDEAIVIEDDCWIGFGVVIMPGVYIGKGAVIGANSVVTKSVFPYTIHGGVPSKEISKRFDFSLAHAELDISNELHWPFFYRGLDYSQFDHIHSIKEGIVLALEAGVFLLKKMPFLNIEIKGFCLESTHFRFFVNGLLVFEKEILIGEFSIQHSPEFSEFNERLEERYSKEIEELFHIITVVTVPIVRNDKNRRAIWKVKSVKIS